MRSSARVCKSARGRQRHGIKVPMHLGRDKGEFEAQAERGNVFESTDLQRRTRSWRDSDFDSLRILGRMTNVHSAIASIHTVNKSSGRAKLGASVSITSRDECDETIYD